MTDSGCSCKPATVYKMEGGYERHRALLCESQQGSEIKIDTQGSPEQR